MNLTNKNRGAVVNRVLKKTRLLTLSAKRDSPPETLPCPSANIRKKEYLITFFA